MSGTHADACHGAVICDEEEDEDEDVAYSISPLATRVGGSVSGIE